MKLKFSLFCVILMIFSSGCLSSIEKDIFAGKDINSNISFSEFNLTDSNGDYFNSQTLDGKIVIVNFFYTNCPNNCPIFTGDLKQIHDEFESDIGTNISIISITVDPWRDSWELISDYKDYFNVTWPHLSVEFLNDEICFFFLNVDI